MSEATGTGPTAEDATATTDPLLVAAARAGDLAEADRLLAAGADPGQRDLSSWCALDWAAGRGDVALIERLLRAGADVLATGRERRTPYQIALAAGHAAAVTALAAAEDAIDPAAADGRYWRPYCRAYPASQLRRFAGWRTEDEPLPDPRDQDETGTDPVLYLHDDLTVTASMWRGEDVVFDTVTEHWRRFCTGELGFRVPHDLDLLVPADQLAEGSG